MEISPDKTYENIKNLEIVYGDLSGGGYKVLFDFERRIARWTDEYVWNNNFMRTLNENKFNNFIELLPSTELINWVSDYYEGKGQECGRNVPSLSQWKVIITFNDGSTLEAEAVRHFPYKWNDLKHLVEDTTDCFLKLR